VGGLKVAKEEEDLVKQGLEAFASGNFAAALESFRNADVLEKTPFVRSCEALSSARVEARYRDSIAACVEAVRQDPKNSEIYLNLGRIHLLAGQKKAAMHVFGLGLRSGKNLRIIDELAGLGIRRPPPLPFLARENLINKQLGLFLRKLGVR
jgi:tetratricopeptide (TPR) repeat protein